MTAMNIMVISDTHGNITKATELYDRLNPGAHFDLVIHCGDYVRDAIAFQAQTGCDLVCVPGNCDGCHDRNYEVVNTPAGKMLVTHGYAENVKSDLMKLYYLAEENECKAVCFGHTHVSGIWDIAGIKMINPGSLTNPRGGTQPSAAIIAATDKGFTASVVKY